MDRDFVDHVVILLLLILAASCQTCDNTEGLKYRLDKIEEKIK
jgi:hypothetical protein